MNLLCREDANDAVLPLAIAAVAMATAGKPFVLRLVGLASPQFAVNIVASSYFALRA